MPSLTGISQIFCTQAGKNLLPNKTYQRNATTLQIGTDTLDGTLTFQAGTYTLSVKTALTGATLNYTSGGSTTSISTSTDGDYRKGTFTLSKKTELFFGCYNSGGITSAQVSELQLEVGNSRTAYNAYNSTIHTVSLGRTIYGGEADVVNGTGTETHLKIVLDGTQEIGLANWKPTTGTSAWLYSPSVTTNLLNNYLTAYNLDNIVCDVLPTVPYNTTAQRIDESTTKGISVVGTNNWGLAVRVEDDTLRTKADVNAWLANNPITVIYKVATPTDFTFTPITPTPETALGVNNFWADEGDSDVTYRADIDLLLGGN